ncbi:hypothetical protein FOH38_22750 [Lysinibacillus fusiformis]|nr:hypothetical protein FOH38_22750 [Lysinibacillus fusiformis]
MYGVDYLRPKKSRLQLLEYPVRCILCKHDVFIPYEVYVDVEEPGIQVFYAHYVAICQNCGEVRQFSDVGGYNSKTGQYICALHQEIL